MSRLVAGRATIWSAIDIVGRQGVQLVTSMILARILAPSDFGAIALMLFFASFGTIVLHSSMATALVRDPDLTPAQASLVFWWGLMASALFAAVLAVSGGPLARFYDLPILAPLMIGAALQVMAAAPGIVPTAILTRELRFSDIAIAGTIANVVSGALGIALALLGWGVWALAAQLVIAAALGSLLYWQRSGWLPIPTLDPRRALGQFSFAAWMIPSNILDLLYSQGFALIVGKLFGPRDLGLYGRASNLQQIPQNVVTQVIGRVSLPLFANRGDDRQALERGLLSGNRLMMVGFVPLMVGIAACPRLVLLVLFGPQWVSVAPLLAILAIAALPFPVIMLNLQLMLAGGHPARYLRVEIIRKTLAVACIVAGSFSGLVGLAWSQVAATFLGLVVVCQPTRQALGCGLLRQLGDLASILAAAGGMAIVLLVAQRFIDLPPLAALALLGLVGVASYALFCRLLRVHAINEAMALVRDMRAAPAAS